MLCYIASKTFEIEKGRHIENYCKTLRVDTKESVALSVATESTVAIKLL